MVEKIKHEDDDSLFAILFTLNGFLGRLGFVGTTLFIGSLVNFLLKQGGVFLAFPCYFFALYAGIMAIQKRCRDIGSNGTIVILLYSLFVILKSCLDYVMAEGIVLGERWKMLVFFIFGGYMMVFFLLLLIPGVKNKNPKLTSPLLKRPIIYIGVCFMILLACRYGVFMYYR